LSKDIRTLDLKNIPCPLNVVKCKLALEKLSIEDTLIIELDKGEPEEMVFKTLDQLGYTVDILNDETSWIRISVIYGII
tara:strand:- start:1209 stop:1445 length:237 start_codon:yes stop_codon:yes gene_type:complete